MILGFHSVALNPVIFEDITRPSSLDHSVKIKIKIKICLVGPTMTL